MKKALLFLGGVVFWLLWPVWLIYFRYSSRRSRVMITHEDEILLVRDWLGRGEWGLPGGGAKKGENMKAAACRELLEEVGIQTSPSQLQPSGDYVHHEKGLKFHAYFFILRLDNKPVLRLRWFEMAEAQWFGWEELAKLRISGDASYAMKQSHVSSGVL